MAQQSWLLDKGNDKTNIKTIISIWIAVEIRSKASKESGSKSLNQKFKDLKAAKDLELIKDTRWI